MLNWNNDPETKIPYYSDNNGILIECYKTIAQSGIVFSYKIKDASGDFIGFDETIYDPEYGWFDIQNTKRDAEQQYLQLCVV